MRNNIKFSASVFIIILSIMFGFVANAEESTSSCTSDTGKVMTYQRALEIAKANSCAQVGEFTMNYSCNKNSGGLIDVGMKPSNKPRCGLVCRVSIDKETTEEGWMCTGAGKPSPTSDIKIERDMFKAENKLKKEEVKNEFKSEREGIKETQKNKLESMLQNIKEKRAMLKTQIEANKEETKVKVEAAKNNLQLGLAKIKNEGKKISTENIVNTIQKLNIKTTDNLNDKITQLENVLVSIDSRISKAEDKDIDVTNVKLEVLKAKESIDKARVIVAEQAKKVYEVNITSEANLKTDMKTLRDTFVKDIKTVRDSVKSVDQRVHDIAVSLAKVPKINEDKIETEDATPVVVEDDNTTQNN